MSNASSDKASESKRPQPDRSRDDTSNTEEPSDYYYDDATGYEIFEDVDDEEENEN